MPPLFSSSFFFTHTKRKKKKKKERTVLQRISLYYYEICTPHCTLLGTDWNLQPLMTQLTTSWNQWMVLSFLVPSVVQSIVESNVNVPRAEFFYYFCVRSCSMLFKMSWICWVEQIGCCVRRHVKNLVSNVSFRRCWINQEPKSDIGGGNCET